MNRQDRFLLLLGPFTILLIWAVLPRGRSEASRAGGVTADAAVVAELIGYAFEAEVDGRPRLLGRGAEADFRLHGAPVAAGAAWLTPPTGDSSWTILPAGPGLTARLLEELPGSDSRPRLTSVRPWARARRGGSGLPPAEAITLGCREPWATVTPVRLQDGPLRDAWGARITDGDGDRILLPWSRTRGPHGSWVSMSGSGPESIRAGIAGGGDALLPGARLPVCAAGDDSPLATLGPIELQAGDLLALGRTRFLVGTAASPDPARRSRLELYHVRDPSAPGYFRASAGHDVYHPNRQALWQVPACAAQDPLTLVVEPEKPDATVATSAAELPFSDRRRQRRIAAAARDHGVPHQLPPVTRDRARHRALLSLCNLRGPDRELGVRVVADSARGIGLRAESGTKGRSLVTETATVPIGTTADAGEMLLDLDGNLLRVAPAAGPRVTRRTRLGLAGYLILVLTLQGLPLTLARIRRRRGGEGIATAPAAAWPAGLAAPTLQQATGIAIASLLFLGVSFHLVLGLHPELAGKPDYLQAFLQGTVAVCAVLAAAAGFTLGDGPLFVSLRGNLERRCAHACLGGALALLAAAGWWWWDGLGRAGGSWLTAWRDRASAAAGAGPESTGELWLTAGLLGLGVSALLLLSANVLWSRTAEHAARFAVRAPMIGFVAAASAGLVLGVVQRSALAFELAILAGLAWYAASYWAFVRHGRQVSGDRLRRRAAALSMASGLLMLLFLILFFAVGADLPDALSWVCVVLGLAILGGALKVARDAHSTSLLRVVSLWIPASVLGMAFASFVLTDMGSVAAWLPALLTGFFLWLVRPEETENRPEEPRKAWSHLLLALGSGLVLLGLLDVFKRVVQGLEWRVLERPQQRLALAEDISYITSGEWITQVRWLASQQDDALSWVPNVNSDIAIFGLAANLGFGWAVAASIALLAVAGCAALAADQALRQARAAADLAPGDRLGPTLGRACGLLLGMAGVLLICQWLVHLATGVVLHLPITGLVFPWISHGNTTHVLFTAAVLLPMAGIGGSGEGGG